MGNKGTKAGAKPIKKKPAKLSSKDVKFLTKQTGMEKQQIQEFFDKFNNNNPDGVLNKAEFTTLYCELRPEPVDKLDEIATYVFGAFDSDNNGSISFSEFMVEHNLIKISFFLYQHEYHFFKGCLRNDKPWRSSSKVELCI